MGEMIETYLLTDNISKEKFICVKDEAWPEMETAIINFPILLMLSRAVRDGQIDGTEPEYITAFKELSEFLDRKDLNSHFEQFDKPQKIVVWVRELDPQCWIPCDEKTGKPCECMSFGNIRLIKDHLKTAYRLDVEIRIWRNEKNGSDEQNKSV